MRKHLAFGLGALCILAAAPARAQFWEKKEYSRWERAECGRMLSDSPWARQYSLSAVLITPLQVGPSDEARESRPQIVYTAQFRSALPVRQALVRLGKLSKEYEKSSGEERAKTDQRAAEYLNRSFADAVVVYVSAGSNVDAHQRELERHWRSQGQIVLRTAAYLITQTGKQVPPQQVQVGDGSFHLVFPREVDGQPVADAGNKKSVFIEFPHPNIGGLGEARVLLEFKPNKMVYRGRPAY